MTPFLHHFYVVLDVASCFLNPSIHSTIGTTNSFAFVVGGPTIGSVQRIRNLSREPSLFIGNAKLKRVKHKKILGVTVDEHLSWHDHISNIVKKVKSGLSALRQIRDFVLLDALKKVYFAVIQPHFDYCSLVWHNCNKGFKEKLQKLQNRAGRIITRSSYDVRSAEILEKLGWLTLEHRWHLNKVLLMHKI